MSSFPCRLSFLLTTAISLHTDRSCAAWGSTALWALSSSASPPIFSTLDLAEKVSSPCIVDSHISALSLTYMQEWQREKRQIAAQTHPTFCFLWYFLNSTALSVQAFFGGWGGGRSPLDHMTLQISVGWVSSSGWQNLLAKMFLQISETLELHSSVFKPPSHNCTPYDIFP